METGIQNLLSKLSVNDFEKLKLLLSIIPGKEQTEVVTLRVFVDEYSNLIRQNRSKSYHISVMSSFKHLIEFFGAHKSIRELELKETENFCSHLQQKVNRGFRVYYRTLKAAFNKAVEWGYVKENYFAKVKLPKRQKIAPVFINSDQLSAISNQIKSETVKDFVMIAFYSGMRLDEIVNLKWKNVDLENRVITVGDENFITKGRKQRFIPIGEEAFEILVRREKSNVKSETRNVGGITPYDSKPVARLIRLNQTVGDPSTSPGMTNEFVFCKKDGSKYCGNYVSRKFKDACKAAGMDATIHFHSLRHSFASNLVQKGVPLYTIKELLGHSSISTTEIYSHLNMETLREAVKKLDSPHPGPLPKGEGEKKLKIFRINSVEKG